jgi:aminoglycoside phosphotransferase (APT) family kinase protein
LREPFERWLSQHGPHAGDLVVDALESPETPIHPQQAPGIAVEIELPYRVVEALSEAGVEPLATRIGYESDPSIQETPFFPMGHIQGDVATENPAYIAEGCFKKASPDGRRRMIEEGLRILARVHEIDVRKAGPAGSPIQRSRPTTPKCSAPRAMRRSWCG